jgi:hypothetical protein
MTSFNVGKRLREKLVLQYKCLGNGEKRKHVKVTVWKHVNIRKLGGTRYVQMNIIILYNPDLDRHAVKYNCHFL